MRRAAAGATGAARALAVLVALVAGTAGSPSLAQTPAAEEAPAPRANLAVAPFEGDDLGSGDLPSVSSLLASYLKGAPVQVTPPEVFGEPPEGGDEAISGWARSAGAELFVTGQVLRFGERLSIHTRLRSADDGRVLETFVEETPRDSSRLEGIGALGSRILGGVERALGVSLAADAPEADDEADEERSSTLRVGGDDPIEIQSEEIEVIPQDDGGRRIVFTTNVHAIQGAMTLRSDRLEAIYPAEADGPARYVATGNVRMDEDRGGPDDDREMRCEEAVFFQAEDRLLCVGGAEAAELREGGDRVRGREIEILFDEDVVKVRGGAFLNLGAAQ